MSQESTDEEKLASLVVHEPEEKTPVKLPKQFGLRTLLIMTLVAGVLLSILLPRFLRSRQHQRAVNALADLGVEVQFRDGWAETVRLSAYASDPMQRVEKLDEKLQSVAELSGLKNLDLSQCGVTNDDLKHLSRLENLQSLVLLWSLIDDDGLRELVALKNLKSLDLRHCTITDRGLEHVGRLEELRELNLHHFSEPTCQITDAGLKHLAKLSKLKTLDLSQNPISDTGLASLAGLTNLQSLSLRHHDVKMNAAWVQEDGRVKLRPLSEFPDGTKFKYNQVTDLRQITDDGLAFLAKMTKMRELDLRGTVVSGAGLSHLSDMKDLRILGSSTHPGE